MGSLRLAGFVGLFTLVSSLLWANGQRTLVSASGLHADAPLLSVIRLPSRPTFMRTRIDNTAVMQLTVTRHWNVDEPQRQWIKVSGMHHTARPRRVHAHDSIAPAVFRVEPSLQL